MSHATINAAGKMKDRDFFNPQSQGAGYAKNSVLSNALNVANNDEAMKTESRRGPGRPKRDVDLTELNALKASGLSLRQIARRTRLGYGTIRRAFTRASRSAKLSQNPTA